MSDESWRDSYDAWKTRSPDDERVRRLRKLAPYGEWCRDPEACAGKGYCPRDPTCGD